MNSSFTVGDRVRLSGGHEMNPKWLAGNEAYLGIVSSFIPGQNETPAAVVKLDAQIACDGVVGEFVILELRHKGATWKSRAYVHVELCNFEPEYADWQSRLQGKWVESHATCEKVK
jgi:hypothetical protein